MLVNFIRTLILVLLVFIVLRIMGKRQIGELDPFEFVITLMIAELASTPMGNIGIPLLSGIIPIIALLFLHLSFSYLSLKSNWARRLISGVPSVIIRNGKLVEKELAKIRCNIHEVLEQLRISGITDISEVAYGILETNGKLSVILKAEKKPATPEDLQIEVQPVQLPQLIIVDGIMQKTDYNNQETQEKILQALNKAGYASYKEILLATIDSQGRINIQGKGERTCEQQ